MNKTYRFVKGHKKFFLSLIVLLLILLFLFIFRTRVNRTVERVLSSNSIPFELVVSPDVVKTKPIKNINLDAYKVSEIKDQAVKITDSLNRLSSEQPNSVAYLESTMQERLNKVLNDNNHTSIRDYSVIEAGQDKHGFFFNIGVNVISDQKKIDTFVFRARLKQSGKWISSKFIKRVVASASVPPLFELKNDTDSYGQDKVVNYLEQLNRSLLTVSAYSKNDPSTVSVPGLVQKQGLSADSVVGINKYMARADGSYKKTGIVSWWFTDIPGESHFLIQQNVPKHSYFYLVTYDRIQQKFTKFIQVKEGIVD